MWIPRTVEGRLRSERG